MCTTQTNKYLPPSSRSGSTVEEAGFCIAVGPRTKAAVGILVSSGTPATTIETQQIKGFQPYITQSRLLQEKTSSVQEVFTGRSMGLNSFMNRKCMKVNEDLLNKGLSVSHHPSELKFLLACTSMFGGFSKNMHLPQCKYFSCLPWKDGYQKKH